MNLFAYSCSPETCAKWIDDVRLNKMITETAQMITANLDYVWYGTFQDKYSSCRVNYPASVLMHPCTIWMRKEPDNFEWAVDLLECYLNRWDAPHASSRILPAAQDYLYTCVFKWKSYDELNFVNHARSKEFGLDFTHLPTHQAYREYHCYRWELTDKVRPTWDRNGARPEWYHG